MPRLRVLDLLVEVFLDLALRALRGLGELVELRVVGLPALALEQPLGLLDLPLLRQRADVGDDAGDLVGGAELGGALALLGREDGVEAAVEGEEHRGRHAGEEHHPQHGILGDDAQALRVGRGDVAAAPEAEGEHADEHEREQEVDGHVGEPHHVRLEAGVGQAHARCIGAAIQ